MWEPPFCGGFQGLWEGRETALCFPRFPSDRHFHRGAQPGFLGLIRAVGRSRVLLVACFFAVRQHLRVTFEILLRFDQRERVPQAFVLDDCGVADTLVLAEDAIGKRVSLV